MYVVIGIFRRYNVDVDVVEEQNVGSCSVVKMKAKISVIIFERLLQLSCTATTASLNHQNH